MLEPPDIQDEAIAIGVQEGYGLRVTQVAFLPLGADRNTAVYRLTTGDHTSYFLKLRRDDFDEISILLPQALHVLGLTEIIAPLTTRAGHSWSRIGEFTAVLYPYVDGQDGYTVPMTNDQWVAIGAAVKKLHTATLPPSLLTRIPLETYPSWGRETVRTWTTRRIEPIHTDAPALEMAQYLESKRAVILDLVDWAERLAADLVSQPREFVVCHADLHAGNVLIDAADRLFIVDWDTPVRAPKERDLMVPGGAQGFGGRTAAEEEALFYQGYGPTAVDPAALAYYRCERIIQDIAVECEMVFRGDAGQADRAQEFEYLTWNFRPGGPLEAAYRFL